MKLDYDPQIYLVFFNVKITNTFKAHKHNLYQITKNEF